MTRPLCILTGITIALSPFLPNPLGRGTEPYPLQLARLHGGDPYRSVNSDRCDGGRQGVQPAYIGCTQYLAMCQQCGSYNNDGTISASQFDFLGTLTSPYGIGNMYLQDGSTQGCGFLMVGDCAIDSTPGSSGFRCVVMPSGPCNTRPAVGQQAIPGP